MKKIIQPVVIIFLAVLIRLVPHMPNFTPITAIALFGGVYFEKKYALILPIIIMCVSDYLLLYIHPYNHGLIDFQVFYSPLAIFTGISTAVYSSFCISGCIGLWLRNHKRITPIVGATLVCSLQFFLITNAAVWILGYYDRSITGLWQSYVAGIPFFRGTFLGDFFYTGVFFGGYELINCINNAKNLHMAK